jgi:hypothetical protein
MPTPDNNKAKASAPTTDTTADNHDRRKWLQTPWTIAVGGAVLAGLIVYGITSVIQHLNPGPAPAPDLMVRDVTVTPASLAPPRPETVALAIINKGDQAAVLTQANITVQDFMALPAIPGSETYLQPDHKYFETMPLQAHRGQRETVALTESVAAGGIEDFAIDFNLPPVAQGPIYLYRVAISVQYGKKTTPIDVFISLPKDPGFAYQCSASDHSRFCNFISLPGFRSAGISRLLSG